MSSDPSAVIIQPVFMKNFLANILSEESFLHAAAVHCAMRILRFFALSYRSFKELENHMSRNFLIESDDDLYSAVPTYKFLWQFY